MFNILLLLYVYVYELKLVNKPMTATNHSFAEKVQERFEQLRHHHIIFAVDVRREYNKRYVCDVYCVAARKKN